jgi:hypothetical protein
MFRFVKSGSVLFQFLSWLFVASLFCDGANLDDLFHGVSVLHDDFEIGAGCAGGINGAYSAAIGGHRGSTGATVGTLPPPQMSGLSSTRTVRRSKQTDTGSFSSP